MTKTSNKSLIYPQLEGLLDLACRDGVDIRPTLLRVLTDLFVQRRTHSATEIAQFVELSLRLIESADAPTRAAVAARLMTCPDAPRVLLDRLQALTGYTVTPAALPASRPAPSANNELAELFMRAGAAERRLILANLDVASASPALLTPQAAVDCLALEAAALAHDAPKFSARLAKALSVPPSFAERIMQDPGGEPLLVAARALAMPAAMLQRILLMVNPDIAHSVARVYDLANLYSEISPRAAAAMVDIWRGGAAPAHYQPTSYDDEKRGARAAMSATRSRTSRRSDQLAARFKTSGR
ncbi:MAG: DUF2336 domain-containing protein [Pseudolabrys sp.]|nr:DUF2336 domain-containing protein [Pseudolabrys sp.]MBV9955970.1 DUF2336 domain-containing protein [Pseudolabrys sp.]